MKDDVHEDSGLAPDLGLIDKRGLRKMETRGNACSTFELLAVIISLVWCWLDIFKTNETMSELSL